MEIEIFKYLYAQCNQFTVNVVLNKIIFEFDYFEIVIDFVSDEKLSKNDNDTYLLDLNDDLIKKLALVVINSISIVSTEIIENRENIGDYDTPISKSNLLFKSINLLIEKGISYSDYKIVSDYEYDLEDPMCPTNQFYGYQIFLEDGSWNDLSTYSEIIENISDNDSLPPKFYWNFYKKFEKKYIQKNVPYFSTNTKARRVGYFKILNLYLNQYKEIPTTKFYRKFEQYSSNYLNLLDDYTYNKGKIKVTKNGISAKPYIEAAKNLSFISEQGRLISTGKDFKVYSIVKSKIDSEGGSNLFYLDEFDRCYFLEILLKKDFLLLSLILEFFFIHKELNFNWISKNFYNFLELRINEIMDSYNASISSARSFFNSLKKFARRIKNWDEPEIYLEHLIMPRLNWYMDLNLIKISSSSQDKLIQYSLTSHGLKLFENVLFWIDLNFNRIIDPTEFIRRFYIHIFDYIYKDAKTQDYESKIILKLISKYLKESFIYFKTLAPNRVTSSQAINFAKYMLYFNHNIKIGYTFIENKLKDNTLSEFIYKFQGQFGDGYIQLKK